MTKWILWLCVGAVILASPPLARCSTDFGLLAQEVRLVESGRVPGSDLYPRILEYDRESGRYNLRAWHRDALKDELQLTGDQLENPYFKIVEFKVLKDAAGEPPAVLNEEPLAIGDYDGQNVLFHLIKARAFFERLSPENPAIHSKVTVRVRANRVYNSESHSGELPLANVSSHFDRQHHGLWEQEIWFFVRKGGFLLPRRNLIGMGIGAMLSLVSGSAWSALGAPAALLSSHWSGVDYVKNPSAVYHEAFHWASNAPGLLPVQRNSQPLAENLAFYFGSSIEGGPRYAGVKSFSDARAVVRYDRLKPVSRRSVDLEYDFTRFIPSFLWTLRLKGYLSAEATDRAAWRIVESSDETSWPSDFPALLLDALAGHPNRPEVAMLLKEYECSFHNQNERFAQFYYRGIHGLSTPERPRACQRGEKDSTDKELK